MAEDTFQELIHRIEEIARRVVGAPPELPITLARDELLDILDLLHRLGKAMQLVQARGKLR